MLEKLDWSKMEETQVCETNLPQRKLIVPENSSKILTKPPLGMPSTVKINKIGSLNKAIFF